MSIFYVVLCSVIDGFICCCFFPPLFFFNASEIDYLTQTLNRDRASRCLKEDRLQCSPYLLYCSVRSKGMRLLVIVRRNITFFLFQVLV